MRYALDAAEPARFALLGLLYSGPRHGYDLARMFSTTSSLGDIVHLSASHLYALLARLESAGLIVGTRQESGSRPPRHVYELTDSGRNAVEQWIIEPVDRPRDLLLDFPLKLYVAVQIHPEKVTALVERQRARMVEYLDGLLEHQDQATKTLLIRRRDVNELSVDEELLEQRFPILLRAGRIARTQALLSWLDQCAIEVAQWAALGDQGPTSRPEGEESKQ